MTKGMDWFLKLDGDRVIFAKECSTTSAKLGVRELVYCCGWKGGQGEIQCLHL